MLRTVIFILPFFLACSLAPTKIYEGQPVWRAGGRADVIREKELGPIQIKPETIVLDARPPFVYSLAHLPGAINLSWQEFTETSLKKRGQLVKDLFAKTRRLARLGIGASSEVVVIGDGRAGNGEEARLAWTLSYLGLKNVEFVGKDYFDQARWVGSHVPEPQRPAVPMWKPKVQPQLIVTKEEISKFLVKPKDLKPKNSTQVLEGEIGDPKSKMKRFRPKIIDCRKPKEYLENSIVHFSTDVDVFNIEWTEFMDEKGRPNLSIEKKLAEIGIVPDSRIMVLSPNGIESAVVVMTLQKLGFTQAGHVAGGFAEITGRN